MGYIWSYSSFTYLLNYRTTSVSGRLPGYPVALPNGYSGNKLRGYGSPSV